MTVKLTTGVDMCRVFFWLSHIYLFSGFVEIETSCDEFVTLFGPRHKLLPSVCDAVRDVSDRLRVVVVVRQQRLGTLADVYSTGVSFLSTKKKKVFKTSLKRKFLKYNPIMLSFVNC